MTAAIRHSFRVQARSCEAMGSPLTGRVLRILADTLVTGTVADRVMSWPGDPSSTSDALALRVAGGLHALVLSGADPGLAAAYAAPDRTDEQLRAALSAALINHASHLLQRLNSPPKSAATPAICT